MKKLYTIILFAFIGLSAKVNAQIVNIPDSHFYNALLANGVHDSAGYVTRDTARAFTHALVLQGDSIEDLTGIEAFTGIGTLYCNGNSLTSLDVSSNTLLINLYCGNNSLTSLNVSSNAALQNLECEFNNLTSLNVSSNAALGYLNCNNNNLGSLNVSANAALYELHCESDSLTSLDVSHNPALTYLDFYNNSLTSLNVSSNSALAVLYCNNNRLKSLDVTSNTALTQLSCDHDSITSLNLTSNTALIFLDFDFNRITSLNLSSNTALKYVYGAFNKLTSLDVSSDTALIYLDCSYNNLISLNVKNGNNHNMPGSNFWADTNALLTCIEVDNVNYSTVNWTYKDPWASFSTNCPAPCFVNIPDTAFQAALIHNPAINTNGDGEIECSEATAYTGSIVADNLGIKDLTGIEAFTALTGLYCDTNSIAVLNLSSNTALTQLSCKYNKFINLNVSSNTALTFLDCSYDSIGSLNVSNNTALNHLRCIADNLSTLNVSTNTSLIYLICDANNLTSLNLSSNVALTHLDCSENRLTGDLDLSVNTALLTLYCYANGLNLTSVNISTCTALTLIWCFNDGLTSLNISSNTALTELRCDLNKLTSLNVSSNHLLTNLYCSYNNITSLDASYHTALNNLYCNNNNLTSLNVSGDIALYWLYCENNNLTSLDASSNIVLNTLICNNNSLTSLNVQNGNNYNMPAYYQFDATNNPDLTCIQVDSVPFSIAHWTNIDSQAGFSTDCQPGGCSAYFTLNADTTQPHHYIASNYAAGVAPLQYDWSWGDGSPDDTISYPSHTYSDSGFYNICLTITDADGCTSSHCDNDFHAMRTTNTMVYISVVNPDITTGINAAEQTSSGLTIYPNPASNKLTVHTSIAGRATVSIINALGQMTSPPAPLQRRGENAVIDVSWLSAGVYFLQLKSENGSAAKMFVKE